MFITSLVSWNSPIIIIFAKGCGILNIWVVHDLKEFLIRPDKIGIRLNNLTQT